MLMNPEMIVGLWFVPSVLFILIPLSTLCVWTCFRFFKTLTEKIVLLQKTTGQVQGDPELVTLR